MRWRKHWAHPCCQHTPLPIHPNQLSLVFSHYCKTQAVIQLMFWSDKSPPIGILPSPNWKMTLWTNVALFFSFRNPAFIQFVLSIHRPGMLGQWWILRQYCTTSTRTKDEMRRRSCDMLAVPVQTVKPATATVKSTALTTVLCPHQARKRSMR